MTLLRGRLDIGVSALLDMSGNIIVIREGSFSREASLPMLYEARVL